MYYILLLVGLGQVRGDFNCLCSYDVEREVYSKSDAGSPPIGYLYEFDCKKLVDDHPVDGWWKIAYEHQVGYVDKGPDQRIEILICSGKPSSADVITTTTQSTLPTTTPTSTLLYTTSILSTTIKTMPTTTSTTPTITTSTTPTTKTTKPTTTSTTPTTKTTPTTTSTTPTTTTTTPTTTSTTPTTTSTTPTTTTTTPTTTSTTPTTTTTTPTTTSTTPTTTSTTPTTTSTTPTTTTTTEPTTTPLPNIGDIHICPPVLNMYTLQDGGNMTQYENYCYEFVPVKVIWKRAAIDCMAKGGNLIHIAHTRLQTYIYKWINTILADEPVWLGLHDAKLEGHFEWVSGDPVLFTNFLPGDNISNDKDDCVHMLAYAPYFGMWYNVPCGYQTTNGDVGQKNPFICEYRIDRFQNPSFIGRRNNDVIYHVDSFLF